ncbi:MAG: amino acid adenylation domain-containing protein [Akkermansiaceae bacterium]|nr:amino acid adenylation domain-containing protein [Akkermansiaceae bacterium]
MKPTQEAPASPAPDSGSVLAFPASASQQMFWYLDQIQNGVTAFNVPLRFRLEGPLRPDLLKRTLNTIVERHESLRTHFGEDNGELLQIVMPELTLDLPVIDLGHLPEERLQEEADRLGSIEAQRAFHLSTGPLVRAELVRLSADHHILHVTAHHAIFDGMSMTVLTKEIAAIYQAYFDGKPCPLEPLPLQYGDFSVWQKDFLEGPEMKQQLGYWKQRLQGMTEVDLPTDFPRPAVKAWKGEIISTLFPKELTDRLHAIASKHGATLFHLQLAAYMTLLSRYSGGTDIAIGTPVTGRTRGELEGVIGVFINSLLMRGDLSGNPSFGALVERVRDTALEALENQELPFEALVREMKPDRDPGRNPLFQVNFNHHRSFAKPGDFGGVSLSPVPSRSPGTIFDLHFFMVERAEGWRASLDYSTDLFSRESADRMLGHFKRLHEDIVAHPDVPLDQLEILTDDERATLEQFATGETRDYPRDADIGGLFLQTAHDHPDRIALVSGSREVTYQQLRTEVTCLARTLLDKGVKPGDPVVFTGPQDLGMVTAFLATLIVGGFCVPLDPSYPADRFAMLLEESGARHILVSGETNVLPATWSGTTVEIPAFGAAEYPEELPTIPVRADQAAFLMFTSGSTGRPKGVLVPHRGIVRLVKGGDFMPITADDVFLQAAPASFDAIHLELWGPLLTGGKLVLLPEGPGLESIANAVRRHHVTALWLTSGLFQLMIDEHADALKGLRFLLSGGDVLSPSHVRKALDTLPSTTLINGYGPTENTTFTTCHRITRDDLTKPSIPIGRPVAQTTVHILDDKLRPVPIGIPGELWTGGDGLAIGYLNAPDLTAERFVNHPRFGRLYRTGDRCRWRADGTIEFFGRNDHQVKVRGFRIELGEIEAVLANHPSVKAARVAVRGTDSETKRILAWVVPNAGSKADAAGLMRHVDSSLPAFMRPEVIAVLDSFPLNANGKVDLAALPDPGVRKQQVETKTSEAPQGTTERRVAELWSELLGRSAIGRHDDFFALGGHSLLALRMFSRINREFGKSLPLATLIQHPTVAALSAVIAPQPADPASEETHDPKGNLVTLSKGGDEAPLFCLHGGDGGVLFYRGLADRMPKSLPIHAIESLELGNSGVIQPSSIGETAASYLREILKVRPQGPFRLAGYSFGGVVAHEIACQLTEMGHEVTFLGLFDTHNPAAPSRQYGKIERFRVFWNEHSEEAIGKRFGLLRGRIRDGIRTHRRVKLELAAARSSGPAEAFSDLRRVQVREENWRAMQEYKPRPFAGRITLFKTNHVDDKVEYDADYGWSAVAKEGLDIISVTGHHLALFSPENIDSLASALCSCLKRSGPPHP